MPQPIEFMITLDADVWDKKTAGWNCDALRVPDAKVTALYHDGRQADPRDYTQQNTLILWTSGIARPDSIAVRIQLSSDLKTAADLATVEQQKIEIEKEKVKIEKEKLASEDRWKRYTVLAGVFGVVLSAATTYVVSERKLPSACKESLVKLHAAASPSLQDQTLDKLRNAVEIHVTSCKKDE